MRARATITGVLGSAVVLGVAWLVGSGTGANSTGAPTGAATAAPSNASSVSGTFAGASESTRYGSVQVKIVVAAGTITDVVAVKLTDQGGRSVQLSNKAAPILRAEVLKSQSAKVSSVSGATYTSNAYLSSVQSAIDKAGI
ncbi:MAG: FMN-binding protein [Actinomycetota bacterium]